MTNPKDDKVIQYINEYYNKKDSKLTYEVLCEMVEEELDRRDLIAEAKTKAPAKVSVELEDPCENTSPSSTAMRFEYTVIDAARRFVGAPPQTTGDPKDIAAYACANNLWRTKTQGKKGPTLGDLSEMAILKCKESGFFVPEKDFFANATMSGVEKQSPSWSADAAPIEPKTDIKFGDKNISVKLAGDVQGASPEAKTASKQFEHIVNAWLEENGVENVEEAVLTAAQQGIKDLLDTTTKRMLEYADGLYKTTVDASGKRIKTQNALIARKRVKDAMKFVADETKKTKKDKVTKVKYSGWIKTLKDEAESAQGEAFIDEAGELLINNFGFDTWQKKHGEAILENLQKIFSQVRNDTGEFLTNSLRSILTDEMLSGRRTFSETPDAIAHYIVSPHHVFSLNPKNDKEKEEYKRTIEIYSEAIRIAVRAKGDRSLKLPSGVTIAGIGCKPSYRMDITASSLKAAIANFEDRYTKALQKSIKEVDDHIEPDFKELDISPNADEGILDRESLEKQIYVIMASFEKEITKQVVDSVDIEETARSMRSIKL